MTALKNSGRSCCAENTVIAVAGKAPATAMRKYDASSAALLDIIMCDLQPIATVRQHATLEQRARNSMRRLGAGWELYCIKNSGKGAVFRLQASSKFNAERLAHIERTVRDRDSVTDAVASVHVHKQCVFLDVTWDALPQAQPSSSSRLPSLGTCIAYAILIAQLLPWEGYVARVKEAMGWTATG